VQRCYLSKTNPHGFQGKLRRSFRLK